MNPVTVRDVLGHGPDELGAALEPVAQRELDAPHMRPTTRRALNRQLTAEVDAVMQRDVVSMLASGWQASRALQQAAHDTAAEPGSRVVVELDAQTIGESIHPTVHLYVDGVRLATVTLTVDLEITLHTLALIVSDAALVGVEFGSCEVTATVSDGQGDELFRRTQPVTGSASLPLPARIPLLRRVSR